MPIKWRKKRSPSGHEGFRAVESACRAESNRLLARETDHKPDRGVEYATGAVVEGAAGWSRLGPVRSAALREEGGLIQG